MQINEAWRKYVKWNTEAISEIKKNIVKNPETDIRDFILYVLNLSSLKLNTTNMYKNHVIREYINTHYVRINKRSTCFRELKKSLLDLSELTAGSPENRNDRSNSEDREHRSSYVNHRNDIFVKLCVAIKEPVIRLMFLRKRDVNINTERKILKIELPTNSIKTGTSKKIILYTDDEPRNCSLITELFLYLTRYVKFEDNYVFERQHEKRPLEYKTALELLQASGTDTSKLRHLF